VLAWVVLTGEPTFRFDNSIRSCCIDPGMLGFMWMVGTRAFMMAQSKPWKVNPVVGDEADSSTMALASILIVASSLLLMISIVNRGVANGGGQAGESYGGSILNLFAHYLTLLFEQAIGATASSFGPLEFLSIVLGVTSFGMAAKATFLES
jgi:hypothetical protein